MSIVLVIGATGKVGRHVVTGLLERGAEVRALVRHPLTASLPDAVTVVEGALEDPATVATAAAGSDAAFLLWPSFDAAGAQAVVDGIAAHAGHLVYLSAARLQHDETGVIEGVWADVEHAVERSDVTRTFVRAGGFAANTLEWAEQIRAGDTVRIPHPDAGRSLVHERDIAEVAVRALLDRELAGRSVAVTGPEVLTQREQVAAIGAAVGRDLRVESQPHEEARRQYAAIMGEQHADRALAHWATLVDAPERATRDVERVTGHPARAFADWAREHAEEFTRLSTAEVARAYADGFRTGHPERAMRLLAPDVVRVAPLESGGRPVELRGLHAIAQNAERQSEGVTMDAVEVDEPLIGEDQFATRFTFSETMRATGAPRTTIKLSLCTVKASRIIREEIFYFTSAGAGRR